MDEHIGVPRDRAAEIIDVPVDRLVRWARSGLLPPSISGKIGARSHVSYSLDDLVQGRVIREIEDRDVHVVRLQRFVEELRCEDHPRPLASLEWGVERGDVFARFPDGEWLGGRVPNQFVLIGVLNLEKIRTYARGAALERTGAAGAVEKRRAVMGSKAVFAGTRIPVTAVQTYLRRGYTAAQIIEEYPALQVADVQKAERLLAS